ncbi:uncharacterized protein JCM15063_002600 [Sporobolomyces koalae]|uniref:uncharacterized protein n=1 Tax=Sporobolomyces koalae TaxID=500713 RepID=UPI00317B3625
MPLPGMRRRSSMSTNLTVEAPNAMIPGSRQSNNHLGVPASTASGSALHVQTPLVHPTLQSPAPTILSRPASGLHGPLPYQASLLPMQEECESGGTSESEPTSSSSSPAAPSKDTFFSIAPSDLRRPSFVNTGASTESRTKRSSSGPSLFKLRYPRTISRRMYRVIRMWVVAVIVIYLAIKSLDFVIARVRKPFPAQAPVDRPSSTPQDPVKEHMKQVAAAIPRPNPRRVETMLAGGAPRDSQIAFQADPSPPAISDTAAIFRKNHLWRSSEEDAWVVYANPTKGQPHESTVIYLHGLRQGVEDAFLPMNSHVNFTSTRWVVPQANNRTLLGPNAPREAYPSWFDLTLPYAPTSAGGRLPHLFSSVRLLNQIIRAERALLILRRREALEGKHWKSEGPSGKTGYHVSRGPRADGRAESAEPIEPGELETFGTDEERRWASKRIVVAGFSQGSVVSLLAALTAEYPLGGVAVFSGFLPMRHELPQLMNGLETKDTPLYWGHGSEDKILTRDDAIASVSLLRHASLVDFFAPLKKKLPPNFSLPEHPPAGRELGMRDVTFRVYPGMEHSWCHNELDDVKRWLKRLIPTGLEGKENKVAHPVDKDRNHI